VRRVEWPFCCTASFWVCSRRRAKLPIVYPDLRLDYKLATLPILALSLLGKSRYAKVTVRNDETAKAIVTR
jgi:hypothetical protein